MSMWDRGRLVLKAVVVSLFVSVSTVVPAIAQYTTRTGLVEVLGSVGWQRLDRGTASAKGNSTVTLGVEVGVRPQGYRGPGRVAVGYVFSPGGDGLGEAPTTHQLELGVSVRAVEHNTRNGAFGVLLRLGAGILDFDPPRVEPDACLPEDGCLFEGIGYADELVGAGHAGVVLEGLTGGRAVLQLEAGALWLPWGQNGSSTGQLKPRLLLRYGLKL